MIQAMQLAAVIQEADRMFEFFLLLPPAKERAKNDRRMVQFLWDGVLQPSKKLLSNPQLVNVLKNQDPQTLLLVRLHEVARLAEDGQCDAAASAWKVAVQLAHQLQDRQMLDERLRWRGFISVRLLDCTLSRHGRSSEGLQQLEDAWKLFGPENMGQVQQTPQFTAAHADFDKHLQARRVQSVQPMESPVSP